MFIEALENTLWFSSAATIVVMARLPRNQRKRSREDPNTKLSRAARPHTTPFMVRLEAHLQVLWRMNKSLLMLFAVMIAVLFGGTISFIAWAGYEVDIDLIVTLLGIFGFWSVVIGGSLIFSDLFRPNDEIKERLANELHVRQLRAEHQELHGAVSLSSDSTRGGLSSASTHHEPPRPSDPRSKAEDDRSSRNESA